MSIETRDGKHYEKPGSRAIHRGGKKIGTEDMIGQLLAQRLGGRILDVATGNGSFIGFLRHYAAPESTVTAVDTSPNAVRAVAGAFREDPVFPVQASGETLCFSDGTFDAVAVANSIHHFRNPAAILSEMMRVLKPGGLFVLREMFRDGGQTEPQKTHIMLHHWWGDVDRLTGVVHNSTLTRRELEAIPFELGLEDVLSAVQTDMETDPKNPENAAYLGKTIQSCLARAEGHPDLIARGGMLRERLTQVGFAGASAVLAVGVKA
ncbi:MAG: class I SAM-dependent methyltransferase [Candidatus Fermentibacteraceae bacterium]